MNFINTGEGYSLFQYEARKKTYVDKSLLIDTVYRYSQEINRYLCVTRPRRFGKSVAANMIAAFFDEKSADQSRQLFEKMDIGSLKTSQLDEWDETENISLCWPQQGTHKVIRINIINLLTPEIDSYEDFYQELKKRLFEDLRLLYPGILSDDTGSVSWALQMTGDSFIFVIDEWDAILEMPFMREEDKKQYILFLKSLLKDQSYVQLAYMTGILPIAKYSSGSSLNMFDEFSAFQDEILFPYFGLTKQEVLNLMKTKGFQKPNIEELILWYDGYVRNSDGECIFNPASVSKALASGACRNYWTGTGPMNEVKDLISYNVKDLRQDIIRMVGGESIEIELSGFSAEKEKISTKNEILSAMVVYGFLTYYNGQLRIPNHELMLKFREALSSENLGLKQTLEDSADLLDATLNGRDEDIARMIEDLHDEKIPFFQYNDENSLACVIVMGYLSALNSYTITREEKAGKGYVDFLFTPFRKSDTAIILELKYNHSAQDAIKCILEKQYTKRLKDYPSILLVGINYSEATKKHTCLTEWFRRYN